MATVIISLALHCGLFWVLYRSDPGWVQPGVDERLEEGGRKEHCQHCEAFPPERSKHDHRTGNICTDTRVSLMIVDTFSFLYFCAFQDVMLVSDEDLNM